MGRGRCGLANPRRAPPCAAPTCSVYAIMTASSYLYATDPIHTVQTTHTCRAGKKKRVEKAARHDRVLVDIYSSALPPHHERRVSNFDGVETWSHMLSEECSGDRTTDGTVGVANKLMWVLISGVRLRNLARAQTCISSVCSCHVGSFLCIRKACTGLQRWSYTYTDYLPVYVSWNDRLQVEPARYFTCLPASRRKCFCVAAIGHLEEQRTWKREREKNE